MMGGERDDVCLRLEPYIPYMSRFEHFGRFGRFDVDWAFLSESGDGINDKLSALYGSSYFLSSHIIVYTYVI